MVAAALAAGGSVSNLEPGKAVLLATGDPNVVRTVGAMVPIQVLHLDGGRLAAIEACA